ncbi:hypothetical protein ACU4GD_10250 [Cupriavidus basilensis]
MQAARREALPKASAPPCATARRGAAIDQLAAPPAAAVSAGHGGIRGQRRGHWRPWRPAGLRVLATAAG